MSSADTGYKWIELRGRTEGLVSPRGIGKRARRWGRSSGHKSDVHALAHFTGGLLDRPSTAVVGSRCPQKRSTRFLSCDGIRPPFQTRQVTSLGLERVVSCHRPDPLLSFAPTR